MFYDLESPYEFAKNVERVLHDKGIWHLEQHYLPLMLECNSYDQNCHEHLEYYSLKIIEKILKKANLKIHEIEINSVNGGSIAVTAVKEKNILKQSNPKLINYLLFRERPT